MIPSGPDPRQPPRQPRGGHVPDRPHHGKLIPGVTSIYTWEGKTCESSEVLIEVKTVASSFDALARRVKDLHSYDVPEIVAFSVERGSPEYLDWVTKSTVPGGPKAD